MLRYNGDPLAPYEWKRLPSMDGAAAGRGYVSLGSEMIWRGHDGLQITDGVSVQIVWSTLPIDYQTFAGSGAHIAAITYTTQEALLGDTVGALEGKGLKVHLV